MEKTKKRTNVAKINGGWLECLKQQVEQVLVPWVDSIVQRSVILTAMLLDMAIRLLKACHVFVFDGKSKCHHSLRMPKQTGAIVSVTNLTWFAQNTLIQTSIGCRNLSELYESLKWKIAPKLYWHVVRGLSKLVVVVSFSRRRQILFTFWLYIEQDCVWSMSVMFHEKVPTVTKIPSAMIITKWSTFWRSFDRHLYGTNGSLSSHDCSLWSNWTCDSKRND